MPYGKKFVSVEQIIFFLNVDLILQWRVLALLNAWSLLSRKILLRN